MMTGWFQSPPPPPPPPPTGFNAQLKDLIENMDPHLKQILSTILDILIFLFIMNLLQTWLMESMMSGGSLAKEAKKKLNRMLRKRGLKSLHLTRHELQIAGSLVDPDEMVTTWEDIGGLDQILQKVKKTVICPIRAKVRNVAVSRHVKPPPGVLLFGPPGCGKTSIAKAMAKESGCWFINLNAASLVDKFYGESEKLTAAVFSFAVKISPCIVFIDEIDALLSTRGIGDSEVGSNMKALFMSLWDGLVTDQSKTVILMGATNRPSQVDPAILRRMTSKLHIPRPNVHQRRQILNLILQDEDLSNNVTAGALADLTEDFSGSDLEELTRSAAVIGASELPQLVGLGLEFQNIVDAKTGVTSWVRWLIRRCGGDMENLGHPVARRRRNLTQRSITMEDFESVIKEMKAARQNIAYDGGLI